jgi:hypothetical protein
MLQRPTLALTGAIVVALAVGGFFSSKLVANWDRLEEFARSDAGPRTIGMTVGAVLVIVAAVVALVMRPPTGA